MQNLPCEVVRDLLPSYVDGLTSETTTALVEAHLDTCPDCRAALAVMREPDGRAVSENDQRYVFLLVQRYFIGIMSSAGCSPCTCDTGTAAAQYNNDSGQYNILFKHKDLLYDHIL